MDRLRKILPNKISIINSPEKITHKTKITCYCEECKKEWGIKVSTILYHRKEEYCPYCRKKKEDERNIGILKERAILAAPSNVFITDVYKRRGVYIVKGIDNNKNKIGEAKGEFEQYYYQFIKGKKRKYETKGTYSGNTIAWVEKVSKIHPEFKYDKTNFINNNTKVTVTCPIHGDILVYPKSFGKKTYSCPFCKKDLSVENKKKRKQEEIDRFNQKYNLYKNTFFSKCKEIHGDKYDYSKVEYINSHTKVCIICPEHGEFWQIPNLHVNRKAGCPKCWNKKRGKEGVIGTEEFIRRARKIHGDKYDYSKVEYVKNSAKVCIICPEHGEFWQTPKNHMNGYGCKKCSGSYMDRELFIKEASYVHANKYDYSKVEYVNNKTKICIICPEHGEFWQEPLSHKQGQGCPLCKESHLERNVRIALDSTNIIYTYQYHNKDIFERQSLDFFFPEKKIGIECQGEQHFIANFFKSKGIEYAEQHLKYIKKLDDRKKKICEDNSIKLIYFLENKFSKYMKEDDIYFTDVNELIHYIKNYK